MIQFILVILATVVFTTKPSLANHENTFRVEVPIEKVFVPPKGFDSTDNVQIVVTGKLPNLCYQLADTVVAIDRANNRLAVRQFAQLQPTSDCMKPTIPNHLNLPSGYYQDVSLGLLHEGSYTALYKGTNGSLLERKFEVSQASSTETDDALYAPVSDVFIPELVYETKNAEIALTGAMPTCLDWKTVEIQRFDDVIAVMPKMQKISGASCEGAPIPLERIVGLGILTPGKYLIHVRSMNGVGINKVVTVLKRQIDVGGAYSPLHK